MRFRAALAAIAAIALLAAAAPAQAGTLSRVSLGDGTFAYRYSDTSSSRINELDLQKVGTNLEIFDVQIAIGTGTTCVAITPTPNPPGIRCPSDAAVRIDVFLGGGNDFVHFDHNSGAGSDTVTQPARVFGEAGNDCLEGTDQADLIDGGTSSIGETGTGNDRVFGSLGSDTIRGEDGNDILNGHWDLGGAAGGCDNRANPVGTDVGDVIDGGTGNDTIIGDAGNDTITDFSGPNTLLNGNPAAINGGAGNDDIRTSANFADNVDGGEGNDTILGSSQGTAPVNNDVLRGGGGTDTITGGAANETIEGGAGGDTIFGMAGNDTIFGASNGNTTGDTANTITPGPGRDIVNGGGTASDTVSYADAGRRSGVNVTLATGAGDDGSAEDGAPGQRDVLTAVERVTGSALNDRLTGDDQANTLSGGVGDDTLAGGAGNDTINGNDGDDVIDGGAGSDTMTGGNGTDLADYSSRGAPVNVTLNTTGRNDGTDVIDGTAGSLDDVESTEGVRGGTAADQLTAAATAGSTLIGNGGDDILNGGTGADTLDGGAGADRMDGKAGVDTVTYASAPAAVTVTLNDGNANDGGVQDTSGANRDRTIATENVVGGPGDDELTGDGGNNRLDGGPGDDELRGLLGADQLIGGDGADLASFSDRTGPVDLSLDGVNNDGAAGEGDLIDTEAAEGGAGDDKLTGSPGSDELLGGGGNDSIDGQPGIDALFGEAGDDTINARDSTADAVDCGDGTDGGEADVEDNLTSCENINPLPPPPPIIVGSGIVDADGDGAPAGFDCDDADPKRRPAIPEVPGNAIDEDCVNGASPFPLLDVAITWLFETRDSGTRFPNVTVTRIPAGAQVRLTCKAPRGRANRNVCPFKTVTRSFPNGSTRLRLTSRFKKREFRRNRTVLELQVIHPAAIGRVVRYTIGRPGKVPRRQNLCLAPGARRAGRC
jgi:Ca2+-binding RTX toxin-like protein